MEMAPLDYGPVLLRKPFGSRLTADTLPSGCPCGQTSTVGASPWQCPSFPTSCPCRVRHGRVPQPTRHYPRLWIGRSSSERPRDFNPQDQNAAQHTLRACPTSRARSSSAYVLGLPDASHRAIRHERTRISRFPCEVLPCVLGVSDRAGLRRVSRYRRAGWCLPLLPTASAPRRWVLSRLNTRPARTPVNASTPPLQATPHDSGPVWVANPSPYLSFTTPRRFNRRTGSVP